ncbi:uncharacterized protein LOC114459639 [Tachysurus ichikawai]
MEWFKRYPNKKRPNKHVIDLFKINLIENDFEFDSEHFLQVRGTAMGKRFAPSYANIFMAKWEEEALSAWPIKPLHYFRFLDDIWGVWQESEKEFKEFVDHLNHFNESIKIKYSLHQSVVNFLDTVTYKGDDFKNTHKLQTRVYFKETDTHALLHKSSFHPRHTFKGVLKSQLLRFHRICSNPEDFWEATKTLFGTLRKRGYSRSLLRNCLRRFLRGKIGEGVAQAENLEIIPFVSTYSNYSVILNRRIKENFKKFTTKETGLDKHKIISAYKKNNNLKDLLVKSQLTVQQVWKTKESNLPEFQPKRFITNPKSKQIYKIGPPLPQHTSNCIYLIYCNKCNKQYVGETGSTLSIRMTQHRYNIRRGKNTQTIVVKHFMSHGLEALRTMVLQHNRAWTQNARRRVEEQWIIKLSSRHPWGLNEK